MSEKLFYDFSFLDVGSECWRKALYHNEMRLRPIGPEPAYMKAGTIGHRGLAVYYQMPENPLLGNAQEAIEKKAIEIGYRPGGDYQYLTTGFLHGVQAAYHKNYFGRDPFKVMQIIEEPIIEDIGIGFPVGGIPDMVVDQDGDLYVVDHKFSTGYLSNVLTRLKYKHQLRIYQMLVEKKFGVKLKGAIGNAIWIGENALTGSSKAAKFDRWPFDYRQGHLDETRRWLEHYRYKWEQLHGAFGSVEEAWPQSPGFQCGNCNFRSLCEAEVEKRPLIIARDFVRKEVGGVLASGADHT